MVKRVWIFLLCLCLMTVSVTANGGRMLYDESGGETLESLLEADVAAWPTVAAVTEGQPLEVKAKGAILMDQATGTVLYEKESKLHLPIASVTKVMTLLLVMEALEEGKIKWDDSVTCSDTAASMGGSQIWLEPGEVMSVQELVKAAAVVSANDACAALAEHISGSISGFVKRMNDRAAELGLKDTVFQDCSGLDDTGYSCAYDVAVISRELMTHKEIEKFTTIWMDSLRGGESQLVNTNKLVRHYTGATGLKTGTTNAAGHCLSATARREGTAFVAVELGCATTADRWQGARTLLDYGFASYTAYTPEVAKLQPVKVLRGQSASVPVEVSRPQTLLVEKGAETTITTEMELPEDLQAPVTKGQTVGVWRLKNGDKVLGEYPICATRDVPVVDLRWAYRLLVDSLLA